jgi:DNA-binding GntR family transcriptional regulator
VALQRLIGFKRLLEEQGYAVEVITTPRVTSTPVPEVAEALDIAGGGSVFEISRLFVASGKPAIWVINYIRTDLFAGRPTERQLAQSPFDMGELLLGGPVDHAVVEIVPCTAGTDVVEKLGMKPGEAYLALKETHYSQGGTTLGFSLIHVNDHFVRFRLYRGGDGR